MTCTSKIPLSIIDFMPDELLIEFSCMLGIKLGSNVSKIAKNLTFARATRGCKIRSGAPRKDGGRDEFHKMDCPLRRRSTLGVNFCFT